jgi:hypothetical protein
MQAFRRIFAFLTPSWLHNPDGDGEKVLYSLGLLVDASVAKLRQGLEASFPSRAGPSANALTAGERGILPARAGAETNDQFVARLKAWRGPRTHRVRGNAYEALVEIFHYWGGIYAETVDSHGLSHVVTPAYDVTDVFTWPDPTLRDGWTGDPAPSFNSWNGEDADFAWSSFWIFLASTSIDVQPDLGDADLWGGALGTPGYTLGQTGVLPEDVAAMRSLFQERHWNPGNTQPEWVVLPLGVATAPELAPTNDWIHWSKDDGSGTRVAARALDAPAFTHGPIATREDAGSMDITFPGGVVAGDMMFIQEAQVTATFSAVPTGWVLLSSVQASFSVTQRLLGRIADGAEGPKVSYTTTGAGNHAAKITVVTNIPAGAWDTTVANNFTSVATSIGTGTTIAMPDNADGEDRLVFVHLDYFDVALSVSGSDYSELYDETGNTNISMHVSERAPISSDALTASGGAPTWSTISLRFAYQTQWRFWSLDPLYNNTYAGDRTRPWPAAATSVDHSGVYDGDRTHVAAFGASVLPDGTSYAGTRTRWTERVLLLDDGSIPR